MGAVFIFSTHKNRTLLKNVQKENGSFKHYLTSTLTQNLEELEFQLSEIVDELRELQFDVTKLYQDKISWNSVSKSLPEPSKMVLLLDSDRKECQGYLNTEKESWTLNRFALGSKKVSLDKIIQWKPLIHR